MERDIEKHVLIEIWKRPDGRIEKVFSRNPKKEVTEFYSYNCVPCSVRDLSGEFGLYKHMESCEHKQKLSNTDMPQASDSLTVNSSSKFFVILFTFKKLYLHNSQFQFQHHVTLKILNHQTTKKLHQTVIWIKNCCTQNFQIQYYHIQ